MNRAAVEAVRARWTSGETIAPAVAFADVDALLAELDGVLCHVPEPIADFVLVARPPAGAMWADGRRDVLIGWKASAGALPTSVARTMAAALILAADEADTETQIHYRGTLARRWRGMNATYEVLRARRVGMIMAAVRAVYAGLGWRKGESR